MRTYQKNSFPPDPHAPRTDSEWSLPPRCLQVTVSCRHGSRRQPHLNKLGQCHERAPDLISIKMCQNPCKRCKKWSSKMEAFKLGKFSCSIWGVIIRSALLDHDYDLDQSGGKKIDLDHASVWKRELIYLNRDGPLDDPAFDLDQS